MPVTDLSESFIDVGFDGQNPSVLGLREEICRSVLCYRVVLFIVVYCRSVAVDLKR